MFIIYRISNNSYKKDKIHRATKEYCFSNFCEFFLKQEDTLYIIADAVNKDLLEFLEQTRPLNSFINRVESGSNAASFRMQLNLATQLHSNEVVYFHEDDYIYNTDRAFSTDPKICNQILLEGVERSDYVTLYDHPDKYVPFAEGGNPFVASSGVEPGGVFITENSHWKFTNSTTCTFAAKAKTIQEDFPIWMKWASGTHPYDFNAFSDLSKLNGRTVASSIPGYCTHAETNFLSPLIKW